MKNKIIIALAIATAILAWLYFSKPEIIKTVIKTETRIDTITRTIDNTKPQEIKTITIRIPDTIRINKTDTITRIEYHDQITNQYKYKDSLENGTITSTIIADKIYDRQIQLKTYNKTTTTEITNTIVKSQFYSGPGFQFNEGSLQAATANIYYTHKNKFLIIGGAGYSFEATKPFFKIGVGFRF